MEPLSIVLSALIGLVSPAGLVLDRMAESNIRQRLVAADQVKVRIDNAPSYRALQGRVDRLRIAGKGWVLIPDVRIDTVELESDPITVDRNRLKLTQPLQAGVRLVLKPEDINRALRSPRVLERLRRMGLEAFSSQARQFERYELLNPQVTLLSGGYVRIQVELKEQGYPNVLKVTAEAKPSLTSGQILKIQELKLFVNDQPLPDRLAQALAERIEARFDLAELEPLGITARVLNFTIDPASLEVAAFLQVRPQ
jgi:hypothetical protein